MIFDDLFDHFKQTIDDIKLSVYQNMMKFPGNLCEDCFRMKCVDECVCDCHGIKYLTVKE